MSKPDVKEFNEEIQMLKRYNDFDRAVIKFEELCKRYEKKYPAYIKSLISKKEQYFQYIKYPEQVRKHIYTTKIVENVNSRLELIRVNTRGYFLSMRTAEVAIYVTMSRIEKTRWKNPMPLVKSSLYELRQMLNSLQEDTIILKSVKEKIKEEELLDGCYIIKSDVLAKKMGSLEIVASYKKLTLVEQTFRNLKSVRLEVRPVYHKTDERIRCHVFICMLAYYLWWHMSRRLEGLFKRNGKVKNRRWTLEFVIERVKSL